MTINQGDIEIDLRTLNRAKRLEIYEVITQEQQAHQFMGRVEVEEVNENVHEKLLYIQYRPIIRESAKTFNAVVVYDVSTKSDLDSESLNDF